MNTQIDFEHALSKLDAEINRVEALVNDLLNVMDDEQLVRLVYRLRKAGKDDTAGLLDDELERRGDDTGAQAQ
jgi:hypothetical protein